MQKMKMKEGNIYDTEFVGIILKDMPDSCRRSVNSPQKKSRRNKKHLAKTGRNNSGSRAPLGTRCCPPAATRKPELRRGGASCSAAGVSSSSDLPGLEGFAFQADEGAMMAKVAIGKFCNFCCKLWRIFGGLVLGC